MPDYETSKERSLDMAFLIDPESLRLLEELLEEGKGPVEYKVKFSDGSTVRYSSAHEVVKQPNSDKRFIVSIISSVEGRNRLSAFITVRDDPAPSVEYTINGPQRHGTLANSLIYWGG